MAALTPMMQQYFNIKENYKDCILFFRLGDFYEMFFDDALTASKALDITLTGRDCGQEERAPMCGVPYHAADGYISKLITQGFKVAIAEQVEDPSQAKGIVKRDVIRVVTPGTVTDSVMLDEKKNNYILCIYKMGIYFGVCVADVSTGAIKATSILWGNSELKMLDEVAKYSPSEVIFNNMAFDDVHLMTQFKRRFTSNISAFSENNFSLENCEKLISKYFDKFNLSSEYPEFNAIGGMLAYLEETQKISLGHLNEIQVYKLEEFVAIDSSSRRNLELTETLRDKSRKGSLLWVLDRTMTSMGARLLKTWIEQPLVNIEKINLRLDSVEEYFNKFMLRSELREYMKRVYDIERLLGKVVFGNANCRDLIALKRSIQNLPEILAILKEVITPLNLQIASQIDPLEDVFSLIDASIIEEPPISLKDGDIIKDGFNDQIDEYRTAKREGKSWVASLESAERERTGIKNLKISYNRVFGYYFEITKSYYDLIPQDYIRKQTLANAERFITEELKKIEEAILGAEEKLVELEYQIFISIREKIAENLVRIKATALALAQTDVLTSLAETADREGYCKPVIDDSDLIEILDGRHPVVEKTLVDTQFVANNSYHNLDTDRLAIITGPNMAGKSTYMRQIALISLMAQIGSFVPAKDARIGIVDKIFTRIGASDDLAGGQSTFMVEMIEVANILENSSARSLLILDEVGRGTSTYDGLSIAWAVLEYINNKIGARTLFATHYHELTELEGKLDGVKNYCMSVKEDGEDVIFLRKLIRGGADGSHGIHVARLAGIPRGVLERAKEILVELESADINRRDGRWKRRSVSLDGQIDLFNSVAAEKGNDELVETLENLDISNMTPVDAMRTLYDLQMKLKNR